MITKKNILGVGITNATQKEILEYIVKSLVNFKKKLFFVTPNPEFLVLANKNPAFKNILNKADLASADGIGIIIAGLILGKSLKERFTGADVVKRLCEAVAEKPITVGFLGGGAGVAERASECLGTKYPSLKIAFAASEWSMNGFETAKKIESRIPTSPRLRGAGKNQESSKSNNHNSLFMIHNSVDILFVAFGAPKQEFWISENLDKIPVKIAIGVGGAFDYISGRVPWAPKFIRNIGMEWLFRLITQPWRIKRQLALLEFIWLVIKEKLKIGI